MLTAHIKCTETTWALFRTLGPIKDVLLKKKNVAIGYHKLCEAVAEGIIFQIKIASEENFAVYLTKSLPISDHNWLINGLFYG